MSSKLWDSMESLASAITRETSVSTDPRTPEYTYKTSVTKAKIGSFRPDRGCASVTFKFSLGDDG